MRTGNEFDVEQGLNVAVCTTLVNENCVVFCCSDQNAENNGGSDSEIAVAEAACSNDKCDDT
jgi:hypothetical protein